MQTQVLRRSPGETLGPQSTLGELKYMQHVPKEVKFFRELIFFLVWCAVFQQRLTPQGGNGIEITLRAR